MPFNGSGTFVRLRNWVNDAAASIRIRADFHDSEDDNFASGLSQCITKDGQTTITADLPMATYKHTNVGAATARTHYARYDQVQDGKINWADAGGTADAITASYSPPITTLVDGQLCFVRAGAANTTTTPTFSPDSLTPRTIVKTGGVALVVGDIVGDGHELILRYDLANTRWELLNPATQFDESLDYDFTGDVTFAGSSVPVKITSSGTSALRIDNNAAAIEKAIQFFDSAGNEYSYIQNGANGGYMAWFVDGFLIFAPNNSGAWYMKADGGFHSVGATGLSQGAETINIGGAYYINGTNIEHRNPSAQAWVNFTGTGTVTINDSYNVTSITDDGTGSYTVNLAITMASANYCPIASFYDDSQTNLTADFGNANRNAAFTPTSFRLNTSQGVSLVDADRVYCVVYGDRA